MMQEWFALVETCDCERPVVTGYKSIAEAQEALLNRVVSQMEFQSEGTAYEDACRLRTAWYNTDVVEERAVIVDKAVGLWDYHEGSNWLTIERVTP